jgi:hypothetical protein
MKDPFTPSTVGELVQITFVSDEKQAGYKGNSGIDNEIARAFAVVF